MLTEVKLRQTLFSTWLGATGYTYWPWFNYKNKCDGRKSGIL